MDPDPNVLPSYLSDSDPAYDSGSEVHLFDDYDMFGPEDNPNEIVVTCLNSLYGSEGSFDSITLPAPDLAQPSANDVKPLDWNSNDEAVTSLQDVINTYGDSGHDSDMSSVGLVCHLSRWSNPGNSYII